MNYEYLLPRIYMSQLAAALVHPEVRGTEHWELETENWKPRQNVEPTAKRNLNFFSGCRLLSSTFVRDGFIAKIKRNGTFNTGMKNRISAPVDVLNAFVSPMISVRTGSSTPDSGLEIIPTVSRNGGYSVPGVVRL